MIFGSFERGEALGIVLAQELDLAHRKLRKGHVLGQADLVALARAGVDNITGARLEHDDIGDNAAAMQAGEIVAGDKLALRADESGRCVLQARATGLLVVDRERIDRLNLVDEAIIFATRPPCSLARQGDTVAVVKVVPIAVPRRLISACRRAAAGGPPIRLAPFVAHRVALILTDANATSTGARLHVDRIRERLAELGSRVEFEISCRHELVPIQRSLAKALNAGCDLIVVAGALATRDRADDIPAAVVAAGGVIERFGMPVDPGSSLMLARIGKVAVLSLPAEETTRPCAGSEELLHRLLARLPISRTDIMLMGVGGLTADQAEGTQTRNTAMPVEAQAARPEPPRSRRVSLPQLARPDPAGTAAARLASPREPFPPLTSAPPRPARVATLVLAAGSSTRMGEANKLLAPIAGVPMIKRVADAARRSRSDMVVMVTGFDAQAVENCAGYDDIAAVRNLEFAKGMASSLAAGLRVLPADIDAVVVVLGDMPQVLAAHIDRLISAFNVDDPRIIVPQRDGQRGNPVLWPRRHFAEMMALQGDVGARELMLRYAPEVQALRFDDDAIFVDVDTNEDLDRLGSA